MTLLGRHAMEFYTFRLFYLYLGLIILYLVKRNNCYEVDGFSEFDTIRNGLGKYDYSENHNGLEEYEFEENLLEGPVEVVGLDLPVSRWSRTEYVSNSHTIFKAGDKYKSYMQRFVNLFLKAVYSRKSTFTTDSSELIKLEFIVNSYDLDLLQSFAKEGHQGVNMETVSDIFTSIFSQNAEENLTNYLDFLNIDWISFIITIFRDPTWMVMYTVLTMFGMTLWFAKTHSLRLAFFTLLLTIFFCGFGCNWMRMFEEREVKKYVNSLLHDGAPYHCKGSTLAWYEVVFYKMFGEDCFEFYKVRDVPSMISISPTDVLTETFSSMIVNPSVNIGKAYGSFIHSVTSSVPFLFKPVAIVMGFIVPPIFLMVILCFLFDYQLSLSPMGFHLTPGWYHKPKLSNSNSKREKYIEDLSNENDKEDRDRTSLPTDTSNEDSIFVVRPTDLSLLHKLNSTKPNDSKVEGSVVGEETTLK